MLFFLVVLLIALPIAWLASEAQSRRWLSILLGICSLALVCWTTWGVTELLCCFDYNSNYGATSTQLIDTVIANVEANNKEALLQSLRRLKADFQPTYENTAGYDKLVARFAKSLEKPRTPMPENIPARSAR